MKGRIARSSSAWSFSLIPEVTLLPRVLTSLKSRGIARGRKSLFANVEARFVNLGVMTIHHSRFRRDGTTPAADGSLV